MNKHKPQYLTALAWKTEGQPSISVFCQHCSQLHKYAVFQLGTVVCCRYYMRYLIPELIEGPIPAEILKAHKLGERLQRAILREAA